MPDEEMATTLLYKDLSFKLYMIYSMQHSSLKGQIAGNYF